MSLAAQHLPADDHPSSRKRVVGLIRVSTADQARDDRGGIPRQRQSISETIRRQDLHCLKVFELRDVSGTEARNNGEIQEILRLVASRIVEGLVVADLDRLFRPDCPADYAILQVFKDTGAIIYCGETTYDLTQRDSALFANIRSAISGWELGVLKERAEGSKEAKRKAGKCPSNARTLPLGVAYDRQNERFHYNERIAIVTEIFRLYDEEGIHNYRELGRRVGIKHESVRNLLSNPIYTGWRVINQKRGERTVSRTGKTYRRKTDRAPDEVIRVRVIETPAVSQECFDRVQTLMSRTVFNHHESRKRDEVFNFATGVARCGHCGEIILCSSGKRSGGKRHGYATCKANYYLYKKRLGGCKQPSLQNEELDKLIEAFAVKTLTDPKTLTALITESLRRSNETIIPLPEANEDSQLESLKRREKRILDGYENGAITLDELRARREEIRKEVAAVQSRQKAHGQKPSFAIEEFVRLVIRGALRLKRLKDRKEKKAIILELLLAVWVRDDSIVAFRFREDVALAESVSEAASKAPIPIDPPFSLRPEPEPVPDGHHRCSCCKKILPLTTFFPSKWQCKLCIKVKAHQAHLRRKTLKHPDGRSRGAYRIYTV